MGLRLDWVDWRASVSKTTVIAKVYMLEDPFNPVLLLQRFIHGVLSLFKCFPFFF